MGSRGNGGSGADGAVGIIVAGGPIVFVQCWLGKSTGWGNPHGSRVPGGYGYGSRFGDPDENPYLAETRTRLRPVTIFDSLAAPLTALGEPRHNAHTHNECSALYMQPQ
ncbi:hypothetical protein BU15DRAFT_67985 [Melanogaster broomeanus]|nr:hypothetical protein BU15DRAFT_69601 [Melanogaster broomeanus]KAF9229998.1 hypothetical protein BU15DRAFT_69574 [Melanogaster broomeanus]KAF9231846.1 hypothetical protein BU15DRAFT_67985 [Melanogaster broomeanus]